MDEECKNPERAGRAENPVSGLVDHLFRHNAGQMVAVLTRFFGLRHLDLVEDAIQESMIKAMKHWGFGEIPENPRAWLIQAAKNHILDQIRRGKRTDGASFAGDGAGTPIYPDDLGERIRYAGELDEDLLCMMFAACHPSLSPDSQIALTLKTVSGFSVPEIARAFLGSEEAAAKMVTRAKKSLQAKGVVLEIPPPAEIRPRLDAVLKVLYLMFNEGYSSTSGESLIRRDLCFEAMRLAGKLAEHPITASPEIHALLALFAFQAARLETRSDALTLLTLAEQRREDWDRELIRVGALRLRRSAQGNEVTDYHLEAEIAACHALAADYESTDWKRILHCYDELLRRTYSPVVALNRAVAIAKVHGAHRGMEELEKLRGSLDGYFPLHVATAELQLETGMRGDAAASYKKAASLTRNARIRKFLRERFRECSGKTPRKGARA